jgi:multidrug efflux system membrane fusion protein
VSARASHAPLGVLSLAATLFAVPGCRGSASQPPPAEPPAAPVVTTQAVRRTVPLTVRAIGHVEPIASLTIRARVGGELTRVWFTEGQRVEPGDTLFTIDPRPFEIALREAEARLARDEALLEKARSDAARFEDLVRQQVISPAEHEQTAATLASLRATVEADRAAVDSARLQLAYCTIRSPIRGRTGALRVTEGNLVRANEDNPLVTVHQLSPIRVAFAIPARYLPAIQARRTPALRVTAIVPDHGGTFDGRLAFVDNAVDQATSTVLLRAVFPNDTEALWPGQFVDVVLTLGEERDRVVVPSAAVQTGQQGQYVFVVTPESTAELRPVRVSRADERDAVIESGLDGGETIVLDGHLRVVPGGRVAVRPGAAGGGATAPPPRPAATAGVAGAGARPVATPSAPGSDAPGRDGEGAWGRRPR